MPAWFPARAATPVLYRDGHRGDKGGVYGGTDPFYIASAYYYWSADRVARAAAVLGKNEDERAYRQLADEIRQAIRREYFTPNGRLCVDTQTGHAVALCITRRSNCLIPDHW